VVPVVEVGTLVLPNEAYVSLTLEVTVVVVVLLPIVLLEPAADIPVTPG
jgi:hypothetical protein